MSEFKIKVNVELNTNDLESQLENLDEQVINVKLNGADKIEAQLKSLKNSFQNAFKVDSNFAKDLNKIAKAVEKVNDGLGGGGKGKTTSATSKLVSEYKDLANTVEKIQKQLNKGLLNDDSIARSNSLIEKLKGQMNDLKGEMNEVELASVKTFEGKLENKHFAEMNNYLNKIESTATSLGTKLKSISFDHIDSSKIEKIQNELKEIQDIAKQDIDLELNVGDILSDLDRISNEIKNLEKVENLASSFEKISSSVTDTSGDIERLSSEIKSLENVADSLDGSFGKAFSSASKGVKDFQSDIKKLQKDTSSSLSSKSIFGDWDDFTGSFSRFKIADLAGDAIADSISRMATAWKDTVVETDSAITDLNKVLDKGGRLTGQSLDNYLGQVTQVAKGTGKSSVDVIQGTARAVQSGIKSTEDALKYAEKSAMFANIGDMTQEQADKILTSVMSANGGIEKSLQQTTSHLGKATEGYSRLEEFIDMANHAGNNFAVTTADVGTAMMLSTNALSANGVAMEEQIAMAVAMNEVLQDSSKTGNALKSISANMSGVIFGLKEGDVQANKTAKALESLTGIKLFDEQTGEVMDMYEAMEQLNGKWDGLTEAQKSSIAQTIAGKQNLQSFLALMDNWDTARQYVDDYNKSVGEGNEILRNATDENEQYLDSVQGKWNSIKEDLKATGLNIIDSEMAKDGLDFISSITSVLPKASEKANEFYSTLMGGNFAEEMSDNFYEAFEKIDLSGNLKGFSSKISDFIANTFGDNKITNAIGDMFKGLSENNFLDKWMTDVSTLYGKATDTITNLIPGISSLKGVGEILNIDSEKKQLEDSIGGHKNRISVLQEEIGSMTEQQKKLNSISEEYEKLSKNTKRSATEEEKYLNLKNEIASMNPDLVLGYDSSGSPILKDLKLQNEQYDRQIKLKQQSLRLEENALATDTQKQRLQNLEDYNKALEEYNNSQLYSDTKRKDGFFTDESLQDYAKRLRESNAEIEKTNLESYSKRLEDHQKYLDDERAIQEKYINQMESSNSFEKMSESAKQNMLTFMDTLNWSEFSDAQASSFVRQLEDVSDKIVSTTDEMGEYGKKINEISDAYANNESNMIGYTKALGDIYEASGKLDNQSLMQWFDSLKQYGSLTGDLNGVNACINEMATSLEKVTGIDASTWKTAFEFDPAPIDASSKALQNFLKSYNTGVQNLGKGGLADKLKSQFETLQSSYLQLTEDVANGGEIDIEYLANIKINQPEPIQNLIDEIISDNKVTEEEIELLMTVMPEILNTGEISEETYQQIADTLGMDVQEVKAKFNINAEVDGNFEEIQKYIEQWDGIEETDKQLLLKMIEEGGSEIEEAISKWDSLSEEEKQQTLRQLLEKDGDISEASQEFENAQEGEKKQTLNQEAKGSEHIQEGNSLFQGVQEGEKKQTLSQNVEGQSELQTGKYTWEEIESGDKNNNLNFNVSGEQNVKDAGNTLKELPDKKEINVEVKSNNGSGGILDTIKGWFKKDAVQSVEVNVKGKVSDVEVPTSTDSTVDVKGKVSDIEMPTTTDASINVKGKVTDIEMPTNTNATINVQANVTGAEQINTLKNNISTLQNKTVSVSTSVTGNSEVQTLKASISSLQNKTVSVTATVTGTNDVNSLTSAIGTVLDKTVSVTATVTGTDAVNALADAIGSVNSKSVSIKATTSGKSAVDSLASSIASVQSKTVSVSVTKTVTNVVKNVVDNIFKRSIPTEGNSQSINVPQTVSSSNLSSIPISASDTPTEGTPSLANVPISAKASYSTASTGNIIASLENGISTYKNLEEALEKISTYFGIIEKKSENAFGKEKIELLKHQVDLLGQQQDMVKQVGEAEKQQYDQLKNVLTQKGFYFDEFDNIINYQQKILDLTQYAEELKNASDEASNNQAENAEYLKWMYEEASKELSTCEKYLDEFFNTNKQMLDASAEWQEYENAIIEAREEIEALNRELRLTPIQNTASELTTYLEDINNRIDMIDEAWGNSDNETEYLKSQDQLIDANNKKLDLLYAQFRRLKTLQNSLKEELNQYGFSYTAEGLLANYDEVLNSLVDTQAYDTVKDLVEEYMDLVVNDMAEIELEVLKTNNAIKDIHDNLKKMEEEAEEARKEAEEERLESLRDSLEKTKEIEDEITKIYEKEYNRRKKEIEDFTDAQIKLLKEQKDAYNEMREEQDYEKGARERVDEIEELRRKLEIAEKDNSIAGIKRQKEIREELAKAEEELAEYTQDKIDDDYNESIDKEIEALEQQEQALLDSLAETFSENNIAKMVQEALLTGFVEVNGEVVTLQEAILETIEDSTDAYSVMGAVIKQELVENLNVALDTMNQLASIYKDLDLLDYSLYPTDAVASSIPNNYSTNSNAITVGATNIHIEGDVSENIIGKIEGLIDKKNKEMLNSITRNL